MNIDTLVRKNVKNMSSYSSARDDFKKENDKKLIYLDANESPFDNGINRYPHNKHDELKKVVSGIKNVNVNQVVFGNGTDEILDLIVRVFCNPSEDKIITLPPTYGMYDVIAKTNGVENIEIPLKSDFFRYFSTNFRDILNRMWLLKLLILLLFLLKNTTFCQGENFVKSPAFA